MSALMDNSSNDDVIAAIVNLNNDIFYTHFFDEFDTEYDDDADLMVAVASVLHDENEAYMPQWRGSIPGRTASGPQPGERLRVALRRLLPLGNGVVPKLFLAPFSDVKEVIWVNY
jgi:hypothetical protein